MVRGTVLVLAALVMAGCSAGPSAPAYKLPRLEPVGDTVLVSADGRTITALGTEVCTRAQRLVARSHPGQVALIFENPAHGCKYPGSDSGGVPAPASTRLPAPLGDRALIRAGRTRGTIPYFNERDLASIRRLPFGLRLSRDVPASAYGPQGPEIGDTRQYISPKAAMVVTQIVPSPPLAARSYWFSTSCPIAFGWNPRHGDGPCRMITWIAHGYHFLLNVAVERGMTLSKQELRRVAEGVLVSPRQYQSITGDPVRLRPDATEMLSMFPACRELRSAPC